MFRHGEISTEVDRRPFWFTLTGFILSLTAAVLLFVFGGGEGLAIFAGLLVAVVALAGGAVLFAMLTDRAYIEDGVLHIGYLFKRAKIPLTEIGRLSCKDEVYTVFDRRGAAVGTINGRLTGIGEILHHLDQNGIRVG